MSKFASKEAPWMEIAEREEGVEEYPGDADNPRIIEYHSTTTYGSKDDEESWCSSFANWCMEQSEIEGTDNVAARSWLNWGRSIKNPIVGCIAVLWRDKPTSWKGHVGFYVGEHPTNNQYILLLGGNQANKLCVAAYEKKRVLSFRWPNK